MKSISKHSRDTNFAGTCTHCFGSLGIETRMQIFTYLKEKGASTVSSLVKITKVTQPTVSYHLKAMRDLGILTSKKSGKEVYYSLSEHCPSYKTDCILSNINFPGK